MIKPPSRSRQLAFDDASKVFWIFLWLEIECHELSAQMQRGATPQTSLGFFFFFLHSLGSYFTSIAISIRHEVTRG